MSKTLHLPHAHLAHLVQLGVDGRRIALGNVTTGEPLGSRNLSRLITTPLSPASVRNVMADLEQLGLIYAPHTSAGRLPTELGLRFFVDALMQIGDLNENERRQIESQVAGAGRSVENADRGLGSVVRPDPRRLAWCSPRSRTCG